MNEHIVCEAAAEHRRERAVELLRTYTDALIKAQTSHDPWDWLAAGSAFKRYAEAEVQAPNKPVCEYSLQRRQENGDRADV